MDGAISKPPCWDCTNRYYYPQQTAHPQKAATPLALTTPAAALQGSESGERGRDPEDSESITE